MNKGIITIKLAVVSFIIILITGCTNVKKEEKNSMPIYMQTMSNDCSDNGVLNNYLSNMNISGKIGDALSEHEKAWATKVLDVNPGMFKGFIDPTNTEITKCMWHGEFPGKILTGLAQLYVTGKSVAILETGNKFVEYFKTVQQNDGYLGPWPDNIKFNKDSISAVEGEWGKWDTWGQYHCIYGLYRWYQVTGNQDALNIAKKSLDCIYTWFIENKNTFVSQKWAECNFAISHMFALMYEITNDIKYLDTAEYIVNIEWGYKYLDFYSKKIISADWIKSSLNGTIFGKSNQPRWESLYTLSTLGTLYKATGDEKYYKALDSLWWGMAGYDRHNTGSFGTGEGAVGNPYGEMSETCNTVAWMQLSVEYLKISKKSYVADELELSYYNAALGSLNGDNKIFSYANYSDGKRDSANVTLSGHSYLNAPDMSCCQASGTRGITSISEWAVLTDKTGLYLNYFGNSKLETYMSDGSKVTITQETVYPKNGNVRIKIDTAKEDNLTLYIRVPVWSENTVVKINGDNAGKAEPGSYFAITRKWGKNDVVEVEFDMSLHFWAAEKNSSMSKKTSIYYGPLLLSAEINGDIRRTIKLDYQQLKNPVIIDDDSSIISMQVKSTIGKDITLKNYAAVGKNGNEYFTWFFINGFNLIPSEFDKDGKPQWCFR